MDGLGSECSSGCESGWTLYFEDRAGFSEEQNSEYKKKVKDFEVEEDDEEEDLSMVSDASSGPPHFDDHFICLNGVNNGYFYSPPLDAALVKKKIKKQRTKDHQQQQQCNNLLDDTASSRPVFNFSMDDVFQANNQPTTGGGVLEFSQGFSTNHFRVGSGIQNHIGSSPSENQLQHNQFWYGGNWMGMR